MAEQVFQKMVEQVFNNIAEHDRTWRNMLSRTWQNKCEHAFWNMEKKTWQNLAEHGRICVLEHVLWSMCSRTFVPEDFGTCFPECARTWLKMAEYG